MRSLGEPRWRHAGYLVLLGLGMQPTVKLDVFGTVMLVERHEGVWRTFILGPEGKRSLANLAIPDSIAEDELAQYFDDIYHEDATPRRPVVLRID